MPTVTEPARPRRRLPLSIRIFALLALLLSAAIGSAVLISQQQGTRLAERAVQRALDASSALQLDFVESMLEDVQLKIQLIASDAAFVKYIADAQVDRLGFDAGADARSIQDLLAERKEAYGFDLGIVLDPDAEVLARTDRFEALQENLGDDPFVRAALDPPAPIAGFWRLDDQLYQAASWPLAQGSDLIGFLLLGNRVDQRLGQRMGRVSEADVAFLLPLDGDIEVIGSSLDEATLAALRGALRADMDHLASAVRDGRSMPHVELPLNDARWVGRLRPLDADGGPEIGAALQLTSAAQAAAGYRAILNAVALTGVITLIVALPLSLLLAKASLRPLTEMAQAAKAAVAGDYQSRLNVGGKDELAELAQAFDSLLSDLRGERDIESYVTQLSRLMPDPAEEAAQAMGSAGGGTGFVDTPAERSERLLLAVEHQTLSDAIELQTATEAVAEIEAWSQRAAQRGAQFGGRIVYSNGPKAVLAFDAGTAPAALGCLEALWRTSPEATAALAAGELLTGAANAGDDHYPLAVGLVVRQLDALLADCPPGHVLLTRAMGESLRSTLSAELIERIKGRRSGSAFYGFGAQALARHLPPEHHEEALPKGSMPTLVAPRAAQATAAKREARSLDLRPGARFDDRYLIISVLGSGGMGVVYRARDLELDDVVALKTLRPSALVDGEQLERLKSELKLARRITHPNVLHNFDFGEYEGVPYITMEYVRGMTLRQLIVQAGRVPYSAALRIARQLSAGLRAAHEVGVLHRDIKPENLMLEASGNAKLMDFGIARPIRRSGPGQTEAGMYVGTPHYSAPEQLAGQEVDHRADIYACGVLFCEMFSGKLPYAGSSTVELYVAQTQGPPLPPSAGWPEIPPALEALILRCIAVKPEDRYPDLAALSADLEMLRA